MEIEIIIAVIILLVLAFLATIDTAFSQLSDVSLRRLASESEEIENTSAADFLREILNNRQRFRFALSSSLQFLVIGFTVLVTLIVLNFTAGHAELIAYSLIGSLILSVFARQFLPRLLIAQNTESKLMFLLPFARPIYGFISILVAPFAPKSKEQLKLEQTLTPDAPEDKNDDGGAEDFQAFMEVGEAEGILEGSERELIETMYQFSDTVAGDIMTPRTEICALPATATVRDARDLMIGEKYSRLPVYRDSIDNIEGVIYVRDLLNAWADEAESKVIASLLRPAFFVPETRSAAELLKDMQTNHIQIAVIIDEYGGVAGLITVEDIVEEIVGEIEDEDIEEEEIIEIYQDADGFYEVLGSVEIGKIEKVFDMEIEDDDFTTIAGLVTSELGYIPKPGEKLRLRGLDIEIIKADEKRIQLLRLRMETDQEIISEHDEDEH